MSFKARQNNFLTLCYCIFLNYFACLSFDTFLAIFSFPFFLHLSFYHLLNPPVPPCEPHAPYIGGRPDVAMEHLTCFVPGWLALGIPHQTDASRAAKHLKVVTGLTCFYFVPKLWEEKNVIKNASSKWSYHVFLSYSNSLLHFHIFSCNKNKAGGGSSLHLLADVRAAAYGDRARAGERTANGPEQNWHPRIHSTPRSKNCRLSWSHDVSVFVLFVLICENAGEKENRGIPLFLSHIITDL